MKKQTLQTKPDKFETVLASLKETNLIPDLDNASPKTTYLKFMSHYEVVRTDLKSPSNFEGVPEGRGSLYSNYKLSITNYEVNEKH